MQPTENQRLHFLKVLIELFGILIGLNRIYYCMNTLKVPLQYCVYLQVSS